MCLNLQMVKLSGNYRTVKIKLLLNYRYTNSIAENGSTISGCVKVCNKKKKYIQHIIQNTQASKDRVFKSDFKATF